LPCRRELNNLIIMDTTNTLLLIAHVLIAASIIGLVMLQKGKGADAGAGFGAGASGTVFGARGSTNFLSRSTAVAAALFFATSMGLAYLNRNVEVSTSLLDVAGPADSVAAESVVVEPEPLQSSDGSDFELPDLPNAVAEQNVADEPDAVVEQDAVNADAPEEQESVR